MSHEKMVEAVSRAQAGEVGAFAELFMTYKNASYYVAKKMFGDENKALNIVYETAISVFKQLKTLSPPSAFRLWVSMLLGNICKRRLPEAQRALFAPNETDGALLGALEDGESASVSKAAFDNDDTRNLICAIADGLPADQKLCAQMYFLLGLKPEYIAQALGITPVAVRNRLFGAINKIKEGMYGFEKNGERMYAVPQWLIASSFSAQAQSAVLSEGMTEQVFAMAAKYVFGTPVSAREAVAAREPAQPQGPLHTVQITPVQPAEPQKEEPASQPPAHGDAPVAQTVRYGEEDRAEEVNRFDYDNVKSDKYVDDDEDDEKPKKKKGKGGLIALIVILALLVLAAAAVFFLPKLTDGKIDPLNMVMGMFTDPAEELSKGQNSLAEGDFAAAAESFQKVIEKETENPAAYRGLISAYGGLGDTEKQITAFEKYFELAGRTSDISLYQSYIAVAGDRPIVWSDSTLEQLVRDYLKLSSGDITPNDLTSVTSLVFSDISGVSCVDLLNFRNLSQISLKNASFTDMDAIFPLLSGLTALDIESASLGEIPEVVANIPGLTHLSITNSGISNLAPLSALSGLTYLDLSGNQISDVSALALLSNVSDLSLNNNQIVDVTPLTGMAGLRNLSIYGNEDIEEIELLEDMEQLENLVTEAPEEEPAE